MPEKLILQNQKISTVGNGKGIYLKKNYFDDNIFDENGLYSIFILRQSLLEINNIKDYKILIKKILDLLKEDLVDSSKMLKRKEKTEIRALNEVISIILKKDSL